MPSCLNNPSMPKVRASSGHDRDDTASHVFVLDERGENAHEGHGGGDLAFAGALGLAAKASSGGTSSGSRAGAGVRQETPSALRRSCRYLISGLSSGGLIEGRVGDGLVGDRYVEAVAERLERVLAHLLLLVGDVLALAGLAHAVALDGLGEDHGRLARCASPPRRRRRRPCAGRDRRG